jgi:hypothetical protein
MKFTLGSTEVELSAPAQYPLNANTTLSQAREKSASGVTHVEDFAIETTTKTYNFVDMPTTDFQLLLSFFLDEAEGMLNAFQLTDDIGGTTTVRFTEPVLAFVNTSYELWSGSFTVEAVA